MPSAALSSSNRSVSGLRPVRHRRDLAQIADLIEICFAASLDAAGRAALREMRMVSQNGPLLWHIGRLTGAIPETRGFVWEEAGRVIGNVTVLPTGYERGYIIANVAVLPDYRRRGIARQLMTAALDVVAQRGRFAILQVDADNAGAIALYESFGFEPQRTFSRWRRTALRPGAAATPPQPLPLRRVRRSELTQLYQLAAQVRPNSRGGMGWLRPTRRQELRPARGGPLALALGGKRSEHWILTDTEGTLTAALCSERRLGGLTTVFDLLIQPDAQGHLEQALVGEAIQRLGGRFHPLLTDHPTDDEPMTAALTAHGFRTERTLLHMIWPVASGSEHA